MPERILTASQSGDNPYNVGNGAVVELEAARIAGLSEAQNKAEHVFREIVPRDLLRPAATERNVNDAVFSLANELFGISMYWHKRIVRTGVNTLESYDENPPNLTIGNDDILFLDLGPVFENWEADFGRTFVLGGDPLKHKLRHDVGAAFAEGKQYFKDRPEITRADSTRSCSQFERSYAGS